MKFLIITPAKNEGQYIEGLIKSMIAQTLRPTKWIIVDDGSTDGMDQVIQGYAKDHDFIELFRKDSKAEVRSGGSKVVRAFYAGYERYKHIDHDVVVKLDGDLTLPNDYFESIANEFKADPQLGLCGGYCAIPVNGEWVAEANAAHHVRGALKAYRKTCFEAIGGFAETWNWDGIDTMSTLHKGWHIKVIDKEVKHHRPTSAAYDPVKHAFKSGVEAYRTGNDLGLALIRAAFKLRSRPFLICGYQYMKGYLQARLKKEPKVVDKDLQTFIRKFTYKRILTLNFH